MLKKESLVFNKFAFSNELISNDKNQNSEYNKISFLRITLLLAIPKFFEPAKDSPLSFNKIRLYFMKFDCKKKEDIVFFFLLGS